MDFLKNNTRIAVFTKKEFKDFLDSMAKSCNAQGKKNVKTLQTKYNSKLDTLPSLKKYSVAVISEDTEIVGYLLHLQQLVKSFKTCELFAMLGGHKSFFIIGK